MSEIDFNNQVVIVTGAGNGLGKSHALEFGRRGAKVAPATELVVHLPQPKPWLPRSKPQGVSRLPMGQMWLTGRRSTRWSSKH